jgi:Na+-transporting methylmalonyl-CoA/oxaloacetate decarboxylase gamma subunit
MLIASLQSFLVSLEHTLGFIIVMLVLWLLYGLTALIGRYFIRQEARLAKAKASAAPPAIAEGVSEEEVAAITACAALLMGQRSRVVSIRSSSPKDWSREGRREHFASHRIR